MCHLQLLLNTAHQKLPINRFKILMKWACLTAFSLTKAVSSKSSDLTLNSCPLKANSHSQIVTEGKNRRIGLEWGKRMVLPQAKDNHGYTKLALSHLYAFPLY